MKKISKGLLSLSVALTFFMAFTFNIAFAASAGAFLGYGDRSVTSKIISASSANTLRVSTHNESNLNVKVQVIDANNNAIVYSATMYNDGNVIDVTLNRVYSRYKLKLTCVESWPNHNVCDAWGSISN